MLRWKNVKNVRLVEYRTEEQPVFKTEAELLFSAFSFFASDVGVACHLKSVSLFPEVQRKEGDNIIGVSHISHPMRSSIPACYLRARRQVNRKWNFRLRLNECRTFAREKRFPGLEERKSEENEIFFPRKKSNLSEGSRTSWSTDGHVSNLLYPCAWKLTKRKQASNAEMLVQCFWCSNEFVFGNTFFRETLKRFRNILPLRSFYRKYVLTHA